MTSSSERAQATLICSRPSQITPKAHQYYVATLFLDIYCLRSLQYPLLMRNIIHFKFTSWLLLAVMLAVTIHCVHESAHAMQGHISAARTISKDFVSVPHHCPRPPYDQHSDNDGCDSCANCACHAPLSCQPIHLNYKPAIMALHTVEPIELLPEVYLTKFIPPQNHA